MAGSGFRRAEARWLLNGGAKASAYGDVTWTGVNQMWRGRAPVVGEGLAEGEVLLEFQARPRRPGEPTVVLLYRDVCCRRVDINGVHRGRRGTHVQGSDDSDRPGEFLDLAPSGFPVLPIGDNVSETAYHEVFRAFAKYCKIDISAVVWIDPPEGRP